MTQPDETCYRLVLQTAAQRPTLPDLGPLVVDDTLAKMRENYMVPDSECFSAAIRTWKNAALFQLDVSVTDQQASVRRAKELLAEIKVAHNQSTLVSVSVTTDNINDVLEVLTVSTHHRRIEQAEVLLAELEQGWLPGNELGIKPDADSYISTMRVWGTSESIDKVSKSRDILERAKDKLPATTGRSNAKNDRMVDVFDTFIDVCGSYRPTNDREGLRVLKECLDAVQMMRSLDNVKPHSSTYAALLRACAKLLPLGLERRTAVATIFNFCCDDGLVNENVLAHLRDSAPPDLFAELVLTSSETVEGTKVVPERWTRKALGGKVISVDGRKTTPLSVDGRLKSTLAMKEFKMRRLKDKRNQKLLRGGRLNIQKLPDPSPWRLYNN